MTLTLKRFIWLDPFVVLFVVVVVILFVKKLNKKHQVRGRERADDMWMSIFFL